MRHLFNFLLRHRVLASTYATMLAVIAFLAYSLVSQKQQLDSYRSQDAINGGPELSTVFTALKAQIAKAEISSAQQNEADTWAIKNIDLELSFTVKEERGNETKGEFKFIAVTDKRNISGERVQKITFHLEPNRMRLGPAGPPGTNQPPPEKSKGSRVSEK